MDLINFSEAKQKIQQEGFLADFKAIQEKWGVSVNPGLRPEMLGTAILVKPEIQLVLDENWVLPDPEKEDTENSDE